MVTTGTDRVTHPLIHPVSLGGSANVAVRAKIVQIGIFIFLPYCYKPMFHEP